MHRQRQRQHPLLRRSNLQPLFKQYQGVPSGTPFYQ